MVANPVAVNLVMLLLLLGGAWSGIGMQKEVFPPAQLDTVEVSVSYPGAAPAEVEQGILLPVEEAVRGIQGIREISSTAREGSGTVTLELAAGADRMRAYQDIDQAVGTIRTFPEAAERPEVRLQARRVDVMEIVLYGAVDPWSLRQLGERVRDRLLSDPAIAQVELSRVPDYVTHVEIPQRRLRAYGLSLSDVAQTLERSARDIPAGSIDTSAGEVMLRLQERKQWAEELSQVPVVTGGGVSPVTLGEIASVEDGFEEAGFHSHFNGQPSIELELFRSGEQSPLTIEAAAQAIIEDLDRELPSGVSIRVDSNRAKDLGDRLGLLLENGAMAMVIVLVILALFLEYRLAFWIMMGMTLSFVASLLILPWLGVSLNMISLFGFLIALGIVVDDAIVVGENIYEHRQRGGSRLEAAVRGARDIAAPVTFAILTNIVAFLPLLFIFFINTVKLIRHTVYGTAQLILIANVQQQIPVCSQPDSLGNFIAHAKTRPECHTGVVIACGNSLKSVARCSLVIQAVKHEARLGEYLEGACFRHAELKRCINEMPIYRSCNPNTINDS